MTENSMQEIQKFFSTEERPVTGPEMREFWMSLSDEEKQYFKSADLSEQFDVTVSRAVEAGTKAEHH